MKSRYGVFRGVSISKGGVHVCPGIIAQFLLGRAVAQRAAAGVAEERLVGGGPSLADRLGAEARLGSFC